MLRKISLEQSQEGLEEMDSYQSKAISKGEKGCTCQGCSPDHSGDRGGVGKTPEQSLRPVKTPVFSPPSSTQQCSFFLGQ